MIGKTKFAYEINPNKTKRDNVMNFTRPEPFFTHEASVRAI